MWQGGIDKRNQPEMDKLLSVVLATPHPLFGTLDPALGKHPGTPWGSDLDILVHVVLRTHIDHHSPINFISYFNILFRCFL